MYLLARGANLVGTPIQRKPFKFKPLRESPYKRPDFGIKSNLQTIDEEPFEDEHLSTAKSIRFEHKHEPLTDTTMKDISFCDLSGKELDDSSDGSDFEGWDDETTLVAKFHDG